jgi:hypothetical protein
MDIGIEQPAIIVEPIEAPFRKDAPAPGRDAPPEPTREPGPEPGVAAARCLPAALS